MKHSINLSKFNLRTDLIIENNKYAKSIIEEDNDIIVTSVKIKNNKNKYNKEKGNYITIQFKDITDIDNYKNVEKKFIKYLKKILNKIDQKKGLIIGLGNINSIADSLGPLVVKDIVVTSHIAEITDLDNGFKNISTFIPGVKGDSGINTYDIIFSLIKIINPTYLIVIDSLASHSIERVNKTIQICDTGIKPGSGIGNSQKELSYNTIGIPVIAIGIPTVVDATSIVFDTINYIQNNMIKNDIINLIEKYNENDLRNFIYNILTPIGYNLIVTPKEIDFEIKKLSNILSSGINKVIHPKLKIK